MDMRKQWEWSAVRPVVLMALVLALSGLGARADEFCVGTDGALNGALIVAASAAHTDVTTTIRLQQGIYHVGGSRMAHAGQASFGHLELLGGYNGDCSARTLNPDNTVFDIDGQPFFRFDPLAELLIEGIHFRNMTGRRQVDVWSAADGVSVRVRNNAFVGVGVFVRSGAPGNLFSGMSMRFINNRVHDFPESGNATVGMYDMLDSQIRIVGNTFADNEGIAAVMLWNTSSDAWFVDNIAWNNGGHDFDVIVDSGAAVAGQARFKTNLLQSYRGVPVGDSGGDLVNVDPLFVDAAAGNYRVQNASPAVNSGVDTGSMAEMDLDGKPRTIGSAVDRGAYESSFDDTIPTTLTVTTTADSGPGSLRQALLDANVNTDFSFINFNIQGTCPRVIALTSADLPTIVNGVRIDGWTQPGSATNTRSKGDNATRCIVLSGAGGRSVGLRFSGSSSEQFWVQGLAFSGFSPGDGSGEALRIVGGNGNIVRGNQFGAHLSASAGSLVLAASDNNIVLTGFSSSTVGGESPAHRNVIADANGNGVLITSDAFFTSTNNDIVDNLIGSFALQITAAGNGTGIRILTSGNSVRDNTIINSGLDGVMLGVADAHHNVIEHNRIGIRDTICIGTFCFGGAAANGRHGLFFDFGPHDNLVSNNTIRYNGGHGIFIFSDVGATSPRNGLTGNSLYNNAGAGTRFLVYNGADNDADPAQQSMANRGLNFPVLTRAFGGPELGTIEGTLSTTNGSYAIDIFSSAQADSGQPRGEAEVFHRRHFGVTVANAVTGQNGSASFSIPFSSNVNLAGRAITVTATDAAGNTSELSAPVLYMLSDGMFSDGFED